MIYICHACLDQGPCILTWQKENEEDRDFRNPEVCPRGGSPAEWVGLETTYGGEGKPYLIRARQNVKTIHHHDHRYRIDPEGFCSDPSKESKGGPIG
jgi:hypothetical protein